MDERKKEQQQSSRPYNRHFIYAAEFRIDIEKPPQQQKPKITFPRQN